LTKLAIPGLAGLLFLSAISAAPAQSGGKGVVGILSPSGTFRPLSRTPRSAAGPSTTITGKLVLNLTITVASSIPTSTPILCELQANVQGSDTTSFIDDIYETAVTAAARSGRQATCTVTLPYEWTLAAPTDTLSLNYAVNAVGANEVGRNSEVLFDTRSVPNNGVTTTYTLSGRI
jgi:hypothetical protein